MERILTIGVLVLCIATLSAAEPSAYRKAILESKPVAHWAFDGPIEGKSANKGTSSGPVAPEFPAFAEKNQALKLQNGARIELADPGDQSIYDFDNGDEISVEALVNPSRLNDQAVILSKGRTHNKGFAQTNQNWAFRLRSVGGRAGVNFLFRSRDQKGKEGNWHRWTSTSGFSVGSGWHHVAMSYRFGQPETIRAYIDGKQVKGRWDMGGATKTAPVVDNDELWIGGAMNGNQGNAFFGSLDEIALYRKIIPAKVFKSRFHRVEKPLVLPKAEPGVLNLSLYSKGIDNGSFPNQPGKPEATWTQSAMGFVRIPRKYSNWGIREDWGTAAMVRAVTEIELEPGEYEFLGRSRGMARLFVDGEELIDFPKQKRGGGAHNKVLPIPEVPREGMRPHAMYDNERIVKFNTPGGKHTVIFDVLLGGPKLRLEFGETCLAIAKDGQMFRLLSPSGNGPEVTDTGWESFIAQTSAELEALDRNTRRAADQEGDYWKKRHALARKQLVSQKNPAAGSIDSHISAKIEMAKANSGDADSYFNKHVRPILSEHCYRCHGEKEKGGLNLQNQKNILTGGDSGEPSVVPGKPHESFLIELLGPDAGDERMPPKGDGLSKEEIAILSKWVEQGGLIEKAPAKVGEVTPLVDDLTFLRRAWIDTLGIAPPVAVVRAFEADQDPGKREKMTKQLLQDDRWADNWIGYWQDALAENPNLLKPNLNNTGPFRYWILESLLDNKPMDRFATELITMRGSTWGGGAAGFSVASQNDVPMAAKAHIIGTAFLGVDMKCARCHDAPYHETTQRDLFEMAAMLKRQSIKVPKSSSVPAAFFEHVKMGGRESLIEVTLKIGSTVKPKWPFQEFGNTVPDEIIKTPNDQREKIAANITFSRRFAEVMANRVWKRFMGAGLVEKVDDWEGKTPSDPALLNYITDEFISSGYDLKQLAALIMNSKAYQRRAIDLPENIVEADRFFEGPYRRRMTAEQVVDNAWAVSGQTMELGQLTMDMEGRLAPDYFMNFGRPKRAWQFTTLANERDRPSLAMPKIQAVVDVLLAFGWRNSRQEPTSHRIEEPNPLQPGVLANGVMGSWLTRLTDDSEVTQLCLDAESPEQLTDDLFLRYLTRRPTVDEKQRFVGLFSDGFEHRVVALDQLEPKPPVKRFPYVSWSNHLAGEANSIKQQQEEAARQGEPATRYLKPTWREQAEDAIWALLNAPEMIMLP